MNEYDDESARRLWLTAKGTGMGRKHSGELADLVYYHKVETNLEKDLEKSGAFFYARFKDDVIMMGPNESSVLKLAEILKEKTDYFKLTITGKPRKSTEFLDIMDNSRSYVGFLVYVGSSVKICRIM